ncbi:MAG: hypothetical protein M3Z35_12740 [Nitrospirota bacterium]|nr:hypothetical protein [Nitrospirota bacterium]
MEFTSRVKWGAIVAGLVVGLSVQLALTLLGLAIGAWSVDLRESGSGVPIGTGIWTALSMLIAAFIGGYVTTSMSGSLVPREAITHGMVVWGVTWLVFAWLTTTAMAYMLGGLFSAFGAGLQAVGSGVSQTASKLADASGINLSQLNLSKEGLRKQIESTLQATGKSELQPGEIKKDAKQVTEQAKSGQSLGQVSDSALGELYQKLAAMDREAATNVLVQKMGLSETQARELVQGTLGTVAQIKEKAHDVKEQSIDAATTAINRTGSIAWWLFVLAVLTLGSTVAGGVMGMPAYDAALEETVPRGRKAAI